MNGTHGSRGTNETAQRPLRAAVAAAVLGIVLLLPAGVRAQGDGPRSYLLMPVGTNVLVPTYLHLAMNSDFSQSVLLVDADVDADIFLGIYIRSFSLAGRYAQIWAVPNGGKLDARVEVAREGGGAITRQVSESGFGDPYVAFRVGLAGAPGLAPAEFMKHKPTFQLYAYSGVYLPIGSYDSDRLLNLSTNRWALRTGLPLVVPIGNPKRQINLEVHPGVTFYGENDDPTGGAGVSEQDPLFQVESHLSGNLVDKLWGSIGLRYRKGGETTTDGIADDNQQDVLGGELSLGYAFTPHLGAQATYGAVLTESDGSKSDLLRLRLTYSF